MVHLSFYIYDIIEVDLLIGQPIERLIQEGQTGKLKISLKKNFKLSIPITYSLNAETELIPKEDPMEEVKVASLDDLIEPLKMMPSSSSKKKRKILQNLNP
jgi:hypothetical protein